MDEAEMRAVAFLDLALDRLSELPSTPSLETIKVLVASARERIVLDSTYDELQRSNDPVEANHRSVNTNNKTLRR
jgi:hypothetical protein